MVLLLGVVVVGSVVIVESSREKFLCILAFSLLSSFTKSLSFDKDVSL